MSAIDMTIGINSGNPPTGNANYPAIKLYQSWNGNAQEGEFPSEPPKNFGGDKQITRFPELDGSGVLQFPPDDYRERELVWEAIDYDQFNSSGRLIYELKRCRYAECGYDFYLGATDSSGAYMFHENPMKIRIIDVLIEPVGNAANRKLVNVRLVFQRVT